MLRLLLSTLAFLGTRAQTPGYDWNGFSASTLGCGSDSGALNVGLGQSLPSGATGLKMKQIAFAIYGTNSLPAFIQLDGSTATPRLSTSSAVQCCGSGCDLAVQVAVAGYSWYNSPCGQAPCSNANKWYYMDFSGTAVGTTEQTGISQATFYNSGGSQIGANMINLGAGSVFFMSYTVIIPSPTPTPSLTKSPVSPSLTASETASTSISRSVSASGSIDPTDSRSVTASRSTSRTQSSDATDSRSSSNTMSVSRAPSVTVSPSRAASLTQSQSRSVSPVSSSPTPTQTPYLPWFQGLVGCCHNSLDTSIQAVNVLTPYPFPNMGINRISIQYWPLTAGTATFTIALMDVAGGSFPGGTILASKTFSVVSPGSFPTYSQQVATFTDLDPISSYVLGGDVEYALAFYNATPGIIDLVLGVPSLSPYFWNSLMPEATGSFYTVGETDPATVTNWIQSTNIVFVAVGAGPVMSSSPTPSLSITSSSSPSLTTAVSQSTHASSTTSQSYSTSETPSPFQSTSVSATTSSSPSVSPTTDISQSNTISATTSSSPSISPTTDISQSTSSSSSSSASPTTAVSQSNTISATTSSSSSSSVSPTTDISQSNTISATTSSSVSSSTSPNRPPSSSSSVSMTISSIATVSGSESSTLSLSQSLSLSDSPSPTMSLTSSASLSLSTSISLSPTSSATLSSSIFPTETLSQTSSLSISESTTVTSSVTPSRSSDTSGSPSVSFTMDVSMSITSSTTLTLSPSPQSFQQVSNTTMSATSTPQFYTTAFPTVTPTYSPTQNATLPIIVVDGQATNMTTTNALLGSTLALIIVAVALAAGRYLPVGWTQRFRRMIPQSTIDSFKRDPLGSVTAMVNDPKSILKSIKIPDSVKSIADMVPNDIKEKFVPESVQTLITPSAATVPHVEANTEAEKTERRAPSPEPEKKVQDVTGITEDLGVIVETTKEPPIRQSSSILQINTEDLAAVQAFLNAKGTTHTVLG